MPLWLILLLVLYFLLPYDLVPDFFPGAGWVDDILLAGLIGYFFLVRPRRAERARRAADSAWGHHAFQEEDASMGHDAAKPFNPYEVLGVAKTASPDEIKAAYRQLVRRYHPDKVTHLGEEFRVLAEKKFKEIQRAYQELGLK
jgi:DnaJ like chaperone protein